MAWRRCRTRTSTGFIQEAWVRVKWATNLGFSASHADVVVRVGGVVVHHQAVRQARGFVEHVAVGPLDLLEECQELLVAGGLGGRTP
jgi:hypothetical protein